MYVSMYLSREGAGGRGAWISLDKPWISKDDHFQKDGEFPGVHSLKVWENDLTWILGWGLGACMHAFFSSINGAKLTILSYEHIYAHIYIIPNMRISYYIYTSFVLQKL